VGGVLM